MDMFANPSIGAWVVEQIPCSFAKAGKNGEMGTHYAMVLLDKEGNVIYVGSECEHKHGEGIQAIHEMGGKETCFVSSAAFRHALSLIKAGGNLPNDFTGDASKLPTTLSGVLNSVWKSAAKKHNERNTARFFEEQRIRRSTGRQAALQHAVDRVAANLMGLHPKVYHGAFPERVHNTSFVKTDVVYPRVFKLVTRVMNAPAIETFKDDTGIRLPALPPLHEVPNLVAQFTMLEFVHQGSEERAGHAFAVRDFNEKGEPAPGKWAFSKDAIRQWASQHHTVYNEKQTEALGLKSQKKDHELCIFCGEEYDRMYRHVKGAKHGDRVIKVAGLVCKATTSLGLKMLNNPRHRGAFIKER